MEAASVLKIHVFHVSWFIFSNILKDLSAFIWNYLQGTWHNIPEDLNVATQLWEPDIWTSVWFWNF